MGLFGIVGGLGKKIVDRKKKKMKRRIAIIAILILVVFIIIPLVVMIKNFRDNLKMAAVSATNANVDGDGNWYTRGSLGSGKDGKTLVRVAKSVSMDAGFTGLGYDFHAAIENSDNNDEKYYLYQTLELLDAMSIEAKQPFTLYGLALLTMECNYFSSYKYRRDKFFPAGTDIYTHRGEYSRAPGIGGGRSWRHKGSTYEDAYKSTKDSCKSWVIKRGDGDWGYWNAGAFGFAQLETYTWCDSSPNGADKYTEKAYATIDLNGDGSEISSMDNYEEYCRRVMKAVGHEDFIAEADAHATENGYDHEGQYKKYIRDVNMATSACFLCSAQFANNGSYFPNTKMGGKADKGKWKAAGGSYVDVLNMGDGISGIDTSYIKLENMNEMELNVLSVMCGLSGWNAGFEGAKGWVAGSGEVTEEKKWRRMLAYDLAQYLVKNSAQPIIDAGYKETSNTVGVSASSEQGKKLSGNFKIITQLLYPNDTNKQNAVYNHFAYFWNGGGSYGDGFVYTIDGIIRAQDTFNKYVGLKTKDGTEANIYACVYEGTVVTIYEEYYIDSSTGEIAAAEGTAASSADVQTALFGAGDMVEDWCNSTGKQFNFNGVDQRAQVVIIDMLKEGHAIWRHNRDILNSLGVIEAKKYLTVEQRCPIIAGKEDVIAQYIFDQIANNLPAEQRLCYYTQSSERGGAVEDGIRNKDGKHWGAFDCSAFISYLLIGTGGKSSVTSTLDFPDSLKSMGFERVQTGKTKYTLDYSNLRTGDIICTDTKGHIQMVVFPGTNNETTYILESKTINDPKMRYSFSSHKNLGSAGGYTDMCGISITLAPGEVNSSASSVWRMTEKSTPVTKNKNHPEWNQ